MLKYLSNKHLNVSLKKKRGGHPSNSCIKVKKGIKRLFSFPLISMVKMQTLFFIGHREQKEFSFTGQASKYVFYYLECMN